MSHKLHEPKDCPLCDKIIYIFNQHGKPVELNNEGMLFAVLFNDGSKAEFAICKDCFASLNQEKLDKIMSDEIFTWGQQIINTPLSFLEFSKQLQWFINMACHLRIKQYAKTKEELI